MRAELKKLRARKEKQLDIELARSRTGSAEKDEQRRNIERTFEEFETWVHETLATEAQAFLQVIAVLRGGAK